MGANILCIWNFVPYFTSRKSPNEAVRDLSAIRRSGWPILAAG